MLLHQSPSLGAKGGRGREHEPSKWTGWAARAKCARQENPARRCMTTGTSWRKLAEVMAPQAAQKSL
jgi:hypothetical protein